MRCTELVRLLTDLGFSVRDRRSGHKTFSHRGLSDFHGGSFNCGHGKNPEIKPGYIKRVRDVVEEFQDQIKQHLRNAKP